MQKVLTCAAALVSIVFFGAIVWSFPHSPLTLFLAIAIIFAALNALDVLRMKTVELTEAGLIIGRRRLFKQQTIFVPFAKIKSIETRLAWYGNYKRISVEFGEATDFGRTIVFLARGFTRAAQAQILDELSAALRRHRLENPPAAKRA